MNLLILVTAIFVIVTYFSFGFSDVMLAQKAVYMVTEYATPIQNIINSPNMCVITTFQLPSVIKYFGGKEFFYKLTITKVEDDDPATPNYVVFALSSRGKKSTVIAAKKIETDAEVHLLSEINPETNELSAFTEYPAEIVLDPQGNGIVDSIYLAKQVNAGKDYVFLMTCSTIKNTCKKNETKIGDYILQNLGEFNNESICIKASG